MAEVTVNTTPLEDDEQITFVQYLEMRGLKFSAMPLSTFTKSWAVKNRNRQMGVRPGVPDILVALPSIGLLWVELKRVKGGVLSQAQVEWLEVLNQCPGTEAVVAHGAEEAIAAVESLLPLGNKVTTEF